MQLGFSTFVKQVRTWIKHSVSNIEMFHCFLTHFGIKITYAVVL